MTKSLTARSPGKLILSGEHAVVYGKPALALAINRYAESTVRAHLLPFVFFNFLNLRYAKAFTLNTLSVFREQLQREYQKFLEGGCSIREVLKKPFELLQFTVTHLLETWGVSLGSGLSSGLSVQSGSNIPMGCGMGSSAAAVMSMVYALAKFFNLDIDPIRFLSLGREAENLQHGRSSGLDLQVAMMGGCIRFEQGKVTQKPLPEMPFTLVQTGVPKSTTGQCVESVAKHFEKGMLGEDFAAVTESFSYALEKNNMHGLREAIRENHRLLVNIGVVPGKVQDFVKEIESSQGAAKICGAGTVQGNAAGVVLVVSENEELASIVEKYGYTLEHVQGETRGTHFV